MHGPMLVNLNKVETIVTEKNSHIQSINKFNFLVDFFGRKISELLT